MRFILTLVVMALTTVASADMTSQSQGPLRVAPVVTGLDAPWSFGFLPDNAVLISQRGGQLLHVSGGKTQGVKGVPKVDSTGQGGLLDIFVPRDFTKTRQIYFTYAKPTSQGAVTALGTGKLTRKGDRLRSVETLFQQSDSTGSSRHFGSRLIEGDDGKIYMTIGDRGERDTAQDLSNTNGSILRFNRDGSRPADNPFENSYIFTFGHRNPQGLAIDHKGQIWSHEHGARGGDEINLITRGQNYGWPVIAYGRHYSGAKIGIGTQKDGMEQPALYWDPSIAPSGMMIYSGKMFPNWKDAIFTGSLKFNYISVAQNAPTLRETEQLKSVATQRVRDIREAPDGSIWFLNDPEGILYRISKP